MYRNPNGYGSVVKLSGNRRRPYAVRKTVGYDDRAYPIYQIVGYYKTRSEAMLALANYNADPYDIDLSKLTFKEVYERLEEQRFPKMGTSLVAQHKASFKYCEPIWNQQYKTLKKYHFQKIIDDCGKGYSTQCVIKNLLVTMDKFAYDLEIISTMRSANLTTAPKSVQKEHVPFTDQEVQILWEHQGEPYIDETLFMLYTGCRVSEMRQMQCADVDLEAGIMTGGMKTAAGKNRIIPIHSKIRSIVEAHLSDDEYLFAQQARASYLTAWRKKMNSLGLDHRTHDCRHTFRSKLDGQNKVCVDLIMGHKTGDVGERVYTHKTVEDLKKTIETLSYDLSVSLR